MLEAELERLQNEAEIALNTRVNDGKLLPCFEDDEQMLSKTSARDDERNHDDDCPCVDSADTTEKPQHNFSVMAKALLKTLKRQVTETTESEEEHLGMKRRTDLAMIM